MPKKAIKVYLSREQLEMLDRACQVMGEDRSRLMTIILLNYLKDINLIRECVHSGQNVSDRP